MHIFLGIVFLLSTTLETFQFNQSEEEDKGIWAYVSSPVAGRKADIFILWCYGLVYVACGAMMLHGVHKELTTLMKGVLVVYIILEICAIGFIKRLINNRLEANPEPGFLAVFCSVIQVNLVIFFLTVQVFVSIFYCINVIVYVYILRKSKAILNNNKSSIANVNA